MASDLISHPKHYTDQAIVLEPLEYCRLLPFSLGNALKYVFRAGHKDGESELKDLKKAQFYLTDHYHKDSWVHPIGLNQFVGLAQSTLLRSQNPLIFSAVTEVESDSFDASEWFFQFVSLLELKVNDRIHQLESEGNCD